ncbi:MAG: hypothetical protein MUC34_03615 [Anaerolineae bacterium]|nr:hypothetical protein [Anaerolineae bacterium]
MIPMMVELLGETPRAEDTSQIEAVVKEFVARLTGKQTIYQMIQLAEEISKRGGTPREPLEYKYLYLRRLNERIAGRIEGLKAGRVVADELMVPGSRSARRALLPRIRDGRAVCAGRGRGARPDALFCGHIWR